MQKIDHVIGLWKSHPYYDEFWDYYNAEAKASDVTAPGLHVGGWHDIFAKGTIQNNDSTQMISSAISKIDGLATELDDQTKMFHIKSVT